MNYTENASSSDKNWTLTSDVTDPFLEQETQNHCSILALLGVSKPKRMSYNRQIRIYDQWEYKRAFRIAKCTNLQNH